MKKVSEAIGCALWGMIASSIISFLLISGVALIPPNDLAVNFLILGYVAACFIAGLIVQKMNGFGFGIGFDMVLGATFYLTLWRGEATAWFASLVATAAAFAGTIVGATLRVALEQMRGMRGKISKGSPRISFRASPTRRINIF